MKLRIYINLFTWFMKRVSFQFIIQTGNFCGLKGMLLITTQDNRCQPQLSWAKSSQKALLIWLLLAFLALPCLSLLLTLPLSSLSSSRRPRSAFSGPLTCPSLCLFPPPTPGPPGPSDSLTKPLVLDSLSLPLVPLAPAPSHTCAFICVLGSVRGSRPMSVQCTSEYTPSTWHRLRDAQ